VVLNMKKMMLVLHGGGLLALFANSGVELLYGI
jgi:hypothetical protein